VLGVASGLSRYPSDFLHYLVVVVIADSPVLLICLLRVCFRSLSMGVMVVGGQ